MEKGRKTEEERIQRTRRNTKTTTLFFKEKGKKKDESPIPQPSNSLHQ
jgi:hypothetical protein